MLRYCDIGTMIDAYNTAVYRVKNRFTIYMIHWFLQSYYGKSMEKESFIPENYMEKIYMEKHSPNFYPITKTKLTK